MPTPSKTDRCQDNVPIKAEKQTITVNEMFKYLIDNGYIISHHRPLFSQQCQAHIGMSRA